MCYINILHLGTVWHIWHHMAYQECVRLFVLKQWWHAKRFRDTGMLRRSGKRKQWFETELLKQYWAMDILCREANMVKQLWVKWLEQSKCFFESGLFFQYTMFRNRQNERTSDYGSFAYEILRCTISLKLVNIYYMDLLWHCWDANSGKRSNAHLWDL